VVILLDDTAELLTARYRPVEAHWLEAPVCPLLNRDRAGKTRNRRCRPRKYKSAQRVAAATRPLPKKTMVL